MIFFSQPGMPKLSPPKALAGLGTGRRRAGTMRRIPALWPRGPGTPRCSVCWNGRGWDGRSSAIHRKQSQLIVPQKEIHGYPRCIAAHKDLLFFPGTKKTNMLFVLYVTSLLTIYIYISRISSFLKSDYSGKNSPDLNLAGKSVTSHTSNRCMRSQHLKNSWSQGPLIVPGSCYSAARVETLWESKGAPRNPTLPQ